MPAETKEEHSFLTREIPGLICVFLAVTVFLALISFDPRDPSFSTFSTSTHQVRVHNNIGLAGAYAAALLLDSLGLASFWMVLVFLVLAWRFFRDEPYQHPWLILFGFILLLLASVTALDMTLDRLGPAWGKALGGGVLGDALARRLLRALNPIGAGLLVAAAVILAVIMATGLSVIRAATALVRAAGSLWLKIEAARLKRREQADRAKRLQEALERNKSREEPKVKKKTDAAPPAKPRQEEFDFPPVEGPYRLPAADLLDEVEKGQGGLSRESLMANAKLVEKKLGDFNVTGEVIEVATGPVITMYEYQPAPGVKISKVAGLADDLAMNMRAMAIRIVAPLPGKAAIGIEIPNPKREIVHLKEIISAPVFQESASPLTIVMGVDILGQPEVADLQKMPHLLIAGATGSGKSVGLNAIIMSILFKAGPEEVRFLMIDPKRIELTPYRDLPHLIYPVISEPPEANQALKWAVADMEHRYQLLAEKGVRNIEAYNRKIRKERSEGHLQPPPRPTADQEASDDDADQAPPAPPEPLPYLVIIIDELADLMMVSAKEVETSITRLAQMARAAGIHLILATQRPSVDVLTGVIKANLPTRVSYQVSSKVDSRTILDTIGAEKLLGAGDMLYLPPGTSKLIRIHGAYVAEAEIKRVTDFIKAQQAPNYLDDLKVAQAEGEAGEAGDDYDDKYDEAVALVTRTGKASISLIQRHLRIGYNRAARIIEIMEREGLVGPADGARPRQVLARDI
ncbi:MAG: DNA translocase FtsK 4TM domain-containing protein [Thermodesulfobacteriota bacterium]